MECKHTKSGKVKKVVTTVEIFREDGSLETNKTEIPNNTNTPNNDTSTPSNEVIHNDEGNGVDL